MDVRHQIVPASLDPGPATLPRDNVSLSRETLGETTELERSQEPDVHFILTLSWKENPHNPPSLFHYMFFVHYGSYVNSETVITDGNLPNHCTEDFGRVPPQRRCWKQVRITHALSTDVMSLLGLPTVTIYR